MLCNLEDDLFQMKNLGNLFNIFLLKLNFY